MDIIGTRKKYSFVRIALTSMITLVLLMTAVMISPLAAHAQQPGSTGSVEENSSIGSDSREVNGGQRFAGVISQVPIYTWKILNKTQTKNWVDYSQVLASCANDSNECSITNTVSVTRKIGLSLGLTWGKASTLLDISSSGTRSVSVTCKVNKMKRGTILRVYPMGTRYKYKIQRTTKYSSGGTATDLSGWQYAFEPEKSGYYCRVEKK